MAVGNVTWNIKDWNEILAHQLIVIDIVLFIYILFGVTGNTVVVFVYSVRLKIRMDDRFFILVLGVMDTIVCTINPAFSLWRNIAPVTSGGNVLCKISWFVTRTMSTSSGLLILVIAIQRYLKVCRPFGPQMTTKWKKLCVALTIVLSMVMHIPLFFFYGEIIIPVGYLNVTGKRCGLIQNVSDTMDKYEYLYFYLMFASAVVVMLGIIVFYTLTGKKILRQVRRKTIRRMSTYTHQTHSSYSNTETEAPDSGTVANNVSTCASSTNDVKRVSVRSRASRGRRVIEKHRYSLMFMLIAIVCVITYVPALTANLLVNVDSNQFWNEHTAGQRSGFLFLYQLYILNHVVNPFIYAFFDKTFRNEVNAICCKCLSSALR